MLNYYKPKIITFLLFEMRNMFCDFLSEIGTTNISRDIRAAAGVWAPIAMKNP